MNKSSGILTCHIIKANYYTSWVGSLVALGAAFFAAFAMIFVRKLGRKEHALTIAFYFTLYGTVLGAVAMIFMWQPIQKETFYFLFMIGIIGGIGQVMLTYAYANAPAAFVAPFSYLAIIVAVIFDILLWDKWPEWRTWVGSAVVMGSGLFVVYRETVKKKTKPLTVRTNLYGLQPSMPTEADKEDTP